MRITARCRVGQYYEKYVMQHCEPIKRLVRTFIRMESAYNRCFATYLLRDSIVRGGETVNAIENYVELRDYCEQLSHQHAVCAEIARLVVSLTDMQKVRYFELLLSGVTPSKVFGDRLLRHLRGWLIVEMRLILKRGNE